MEYAKKTFGFQRFSDFRIVHKGLQTCANGSNVRKNSEPINNQRHTN